MEWRGRGPISRVRPCGVGGGGGRSKTHGVRTGGVNVDKLRPMPKHGSI